MDIAKLVLKHVPSARAVTEPSNDPRSYRQNSDKLLATGFKPEKCVEDGVKDVIAAFREGRLKDDDNCHNIRTMRKLFQTGA
jgi:nucleoside-diphosphate-sugar epimerase